TTKGGNRFPPFVVYGQSLLAKSRTGYVRALSVFSFSVFPVLLFAVGNSSEQQTIGHYQSRPLSAEKDRTVLATGFE
ncbi:hypothetical protein, partial [Chlorobium sp.]|uniref:hypothetical protein n=1 Tax=Chlorobium sp. TaxID=1095 RepID=UPI0025BF4345